MSQQHETEAPPLLIYLHANTSKDRAWCSDLRKQLFIREQKRQLRQWHRDLIPLGAQTELIFQEQLAQATAVLVLLSPDLFSDTLFQTFLEWRINKSYNANIYIIPVLLRETTGWDDLFGNLQVLPRNKEPLARWKNRDTACAQVANEVWSLLPFLSSNKRDIQQSEKEAYLTGFLMDSPAFINDRLSHFVGREKELTAIRQRIVELQHTGGFLIVTGPAGQGKSSILTMLVEEMGKEHVAHHFIPYTPGAQHQVELLQNLIAHLALNHHLLDIDLTNRTYPALRSTFHRLLKKIAESGQTTILVIDGLDQLETEHTGWRDLSFIPPDPPQGVVFVLGTRPNDTLKPLALMKPRTFYPLPEMSLLDFASLLQRRGLHLDKYIVDRCYQALNGHVFYLDLAARNMTEKGMRTPEEIIAQVESNPDNLLWLELERLKQPREEWREVIKPILGLLLEAHEPLSVSVLSQMIRVDEDRVSDGLIRLGGLVLQNEHRRSTLFHLKLYDYLRHGSGMLSQGPLFPSKEERDWHQTLARWCEQNGLDTIWDDAFSSLSEQERRVYARKYYITHLYGAQRWNDLFHLLDSGQYGRAKMHTHGLGMRAYVYDLDLGRQAILESTETFERALNQLPRLWSYTLSRCSVTSRADSYPVSAFGFLTLLDRQQEAIELAELVTDPTKQIKIFCHIAQQVHDQTRSPEKSAEVLKKAGEIADGLGRTIQARVLRELSTAQAQARLWTEAERICGMISDRGEQARVLRDLGVALAQAGECEWALQLWTEAERICGMIVDKEEQSRALCELCSALAQAQLLTEAERVCAMIPTRGRRTEALYELEAVLVAAQAWEEAERVCAAYSDEEDRNDALHELKAVLVAVQAWEEAERVCTMVPNEEEQAEALYILGTAMVEAGEYERAKQIWEKVECVCAMISDKEEQSRALRELGIALARAQLWTEAEHICGVISDKEEQSRALRGLSKTLAEVQAWEEAMRICTVITDIGQQTRALRELVTALARAQLWAEAESVCTTILDEEIQAWALCDLGTSLAQAQAWEEARRLYAALPDKGQQVEALCEIVVKLVGVGEREQTKRAWEEVEHVCAAISDKEERTWALCKLGTALVQAREYELAMRIWEEAEKVCAIIPSERKRARALSTLGVALAQTYAWEEAERVCAAIPSGRERVWALSDLGMALVQAGERERAKQVWEEAKTTCATISDKIQQACTLCELGTALVQVGEREQAMQAWKEMESVCASISPKEERARALSDLGMALTEAQAWEGAKRVCATIPDQELQARALSDLAMALAYTQSLEEAEQVCATISDEALQAESWCKLSQIAAEKRNYAFILRLIQRTWLTAKTRTHAFQYFAIAIPLFVLHPVTALACCDQLKSVDQILR